MSALVRSLLAVGLALTLAACAAAPPPPPPAPPMKTPLDAKTQLETGHPY